MTDATTLAGAPAAAAEEEVSVYWMTGCTSCLRTKEFLSNHGVPFRSRNVLEDPAAFDELARFGLKQVPIVVRGDTWANGQVFADVAKLCGIPYGEQTMLSPGELRARLEAIMEGTQRFLRQLPTEALGENLPNRPRSHADLVYHIFNIIDAFVEHEEGTPLAYAAYFRVPPAGMRSIEGLADYGRQVADRFGTWYDTVGEGTDWGRRADVYYGEQTLHQFLERTAWHSGQHVRQLMWLLEQRGIVPVGPLGAETFDGLPMPRQVWDPERADG